MNKKINVFISKDAKVKLETEGFKGEACVDEIKKILASFVEIDEIEHTSDFYDNDEGLEILGEIKK